MSRVASWCAALFWIALVTSRSAAAQPTPTPACPVVTDKSVTITVDRLANVDKPCVEIKQGKTDVVWKGTAEVKTVRILFKPGSPAPPDNPVCSGDTCILEKAKHATKKGTFDYGVEVVLQDGSTANVDPRLIIQP